MLSETEKFLVNIARGAGIIFFAEIIGVILGIINQVLLGRLLGPENFGLFNLGSTIITILLPFALLGLSRAILQFIPHYRAINRDDKVKGGIYFLMTFSLIAGILISFLLYFLSPIIAINIFHNENLEIVIKLFSIAFPFYVILYTGVNISQAFKVSVYRLYINTILLKVTSIAFFILLLFLGYKLLGAVVGYIVGIIVAAMAYIYIIFKKFIPSLYCEKSDNHVIKELFSIAWPLFFAGFTYLFIQYTDQTLIGIYMNASDVGIYTAAISIAYLALFIMISFSYIFLPTVAEFFGRKDLAGIKTIFHSTSKWVFLLTFPTILYVAFFSKNTILLVYGSEYISGSISLVILLFGIAMNGLTGMTGEVLVGIRKMKLNLIADLSGAVSNVVLNILLIPKFGILGAAIGTSLSITIRNLISLGFVYRELKILPYDKSFLKIILSSLLAVAPIVFFLETFFTSCYYLFAILFPIFFGIYYMYLHVMKAFNDYDRMIVRVVLGRIGLKKLAK